MSRLHCKITQIQHGNLNSLIQSQFLEFLPRFRFDAAAGRWSMHNELRVWFTAIKINRIWSLQFLETKTTAYFYSWNNTIRVICKFICGTLNLAPRLLLSIQIDCSINWNCLHYYSLRIPLLRSLCSQNFLFSS